jgi:hypothetical protein
VRRLGPLSRLLPGRAGVVLAVVVWLGVTDIVAVHVLLLGVTDIVAVHVLLLMLLLLLVLMLLLLLLLLLAVGTVAEIVLPVIIAQRGDNLFHFHIALIINLVRIIGQKGPVKPPTAGIHHPAQRYRSDRSLCKAQLWF